MKHDHFGPCGFPFFIVINPSNPVSRLRRGLTQRELLRIFTTIMAGVFVVVSWKCRPTVEGEAWRIGAVAAAGAAAEAYLYFKFGSFLAGLAGKRGRRTGAAMLAAYAAAGVALYAVQIVAMVQSGAVVSLVALENHNQTGLVSGGVKQVVVALGVFLWVGFAVLAARARTEAAETMEGSGRGRRALLAAGCGMVVALCNFELTNPFPQRRAEPAEATPLTALARNASMAMAGEALGGLPEVPTSHEEPFYFAGGQKYPFLRVGDTAAEPAFARRPGAPDRPNVVVLFFEGLSARTIGVYDRRRAGLTPAMDRFAEEAGTMRVLNYYSHTAATFRGLHGQMASCFPERGAWENGLKYDRDALRASHGYRTLADILKEVGYETVFFSPHPEANGLNAMLDMLGFDDVLTMEEAQETLLENKGAPRDGRYERALTDRESLAALTEYLRRREGAPGKPFFAGLYNLGTHATFDVPADGARFGPGTNPVLNNIHNLDTEFGRFFAWFKRSRWAANTVLVLTTDHAHYPEPAYYEIVRRDGDYQLAFCDRIPLMVHAEFLELPTAYDCGLATSLGFAPSMLHLLGVAPGPHSFLRRSIFEKAEAPRFEVAAFGAQFHAIEGGKVHYSGELPPGIAEEFARYRRYVEAFYRYEKYNLIYPRDGDSAEGKRAGVAGAAPAKSAAMRLAASPSP